MTTIERLDVRGPRFAASITAALLLVAFLASLLGIATASADAEPRLAAAPLADRVLDAGFLLLVFAALLFLWGVVSPRTAPWAVLFRRVVRPRLSPPREFDDARPPRFAQGVGLTVTAAGLLLHLAGVPWALPIAAALAFAAAFLNAAFGFCLGCEMYLLLQRAGLVGRARA
ncbi:DUF4395 domain-containing protein [Microbacterium sp. Yaish 1]|uniref:DUF4395 domain-containing protein n=1 Tax=Microbacterium sp. Yaish 1 TaxID=2025014 RepID=UPI000B93DA67|nr:DUF4395 domain-containing protein [Microbacterium sp. Yaish 1]OYC95194.1 hypothetical protein CI089_10615 [Microbacterium sp. Yaish 1]